MGLTWGACIFVIVLLSDPKFVGKVFGKLYVDVTDVLLPACVRPFTGFAITMPLPLWCVSCEILLFPVKDFNGLAGSR